MIIATATASEELGHAVFYAAAVCFVVAIVLVLAALIVRFWFRSRFRWGLGLSIGAALTALYPLVFAWYVYHIDYVAVAMDGTPASGPLWKHLAIPSLPLMAALLLIISYRRARTP